MIKTIIFFLFAVPVSVVGQNQTVTWETLAKVEWGEKYFPAYDETVWYPEFSEEVLTLDSSLIEIKGYVIPVDVRTGYYVLSANPYSSCFFCGNAGPESVMELQLVDEESSFRMDEIITFTGKLKLNWDDLEHCNYILMNARPK